MFSARVFNIRIIFISSRFIYVFLPRSYDSSRKGEIGKKQFRFAQKHCVKKQAVRYYRAKSIFMDFFVSFITYNKYVDNGGFCAL